jgi:type IV pilus assembly protein PilA
VVAYSSKRACRGMRSRLAGALGGLRRGTQEESGFMLIELLVVTLIIGILAAIAIPSFLNQKNKAIDVQAKELVRTAETTAESISTENNGAYDNVTEAELHNAEPSIPIVANGKEAYLSAATSGKNEYSLTATATDGDQLTISRSATGQITRQCESPVLKTGCSGGESGGW